MTAELASPINMGGIEFSDPSNKEKIFSSRERNRDLKWLEQRESPPKSNPAASCNTNLFFGFYHDGTRNNYGESLKTKDHAHTNVARLYSCFPGRSVPGVVAGEPEWKHQPEQFK